MNKGNQNTSILHSNDGEIISQYVMELPVFSDKKLNSAPNQQRKKKVLKPISTHTLSATRRLHTSNTPYQTTYIHHTRQYSNTSNTHINNLLSNDYIIRIKQLENELVEARKKTHDLITENRLLKTLEKRHENALATYEGKQAKLPQVIKSYEEDVRMLQSKICQMKISYKEIENRYKSQSTELISLHKQYNHLLSLSKNKQLGKREKLSNQLEEAQNTIKQQNSKIQNLMKQLELQNKTHKHHINVDELKVKELQVEVKHLKNQNQNLESNLEKLKNKSYCVKQVFTKGITENSISITPREVKSMEIIHGQSDEVDESFSKNNGPVSLKTKLLHVKHISYFKGVENNANNQMKNNIVKDSKTPVIKNSNTTSDIIRINNVPTKLIKENKSELPNIEKNNFENSKESNTSTLHTKHDSSMTRLEKDLLLAKLNQVKENENTNEYKSYYRSESFKRSSKKRNPSLVSNYIHSESSISD